MTTNADERRIHIIDTVDGVEFWAIPASGTVLQHSNKQYAKYRHGYQVVTRDTVSGMWTSGHCINRADELTTKRAKEGRARVAGWVRNSPGYMSMGWRKDPFPFAQDNHA